MSKKKTTIIVISIFMIVAILGCIKAMNQYFKNKNSHYTSEYICNKTGFDESNYRAFEIGGHKCDQYWNFDGSEEDYNRIYFYLFDTKEEAKDAFEYMRKNWFKEIIYQDKSSIEGEFAGVCDALLFGYIHLKDNLILYTELYAVSSWEPKIEDIDRAREACDRSVIDLMKDF